MKLKDAFEEIFTGYNMTSAIGNNKDVKETIFSIGLKSKEEFKMMLFSNDFYEKNKEEPIEKLVLKKRKK